VEPSGAAEPVAAPAPPAPELAVPDVVIHPGALDKAAAKRAWPAVLIEIKKLRPARASQFSDIEVDVDVDGETLVLEFPADAGFGMQLADEPEMRDMLKSALAAVLGFSPPFRYQLGRGAVRPSGDRPAPEPLSPPVDDDPLPEYYETRGAPADPAPTADFSARDAEPKSELERLLMNEMGGHIVATHAGPVAEGDDAEDLSAVEDEIELPSQDGPGLFDTDGED